MSAYPLVRFALFVSVISFMTQTSEGASTPKTRGTKYGRVILGGYDNARMSDLKDPCLPPIL
jgi:hypothetical protein